MNARRCVVALAIAFGFCMWKAKFILGILVRPLAQAFPPGQGRLIYTNFGNIVPTLFVALDFGLVSVVALAVVCIAAQVVLGGNHDVAFFALQGFVFESFEVVSTSGEELALSF